MKTLIAAVAMFAAVGAGPQTKADGPRQGELLGTVIQMEKGTLYVDYMGVVVPMKIDATTRFEQSAQLKEGQEVRVTFKVTNKVVNQATAISTEPLRGTGGSGEKDPPPSMERLPGPPVPEEPGTDFRLNPMR